MVSRIFVILIVSMTILHAVDSAYILRKIIELEQKIKNIEKLIWGKWSNMKRYMGCYVDDAQRVLKGYKLKNDSSMTHEKCFRLCRDRKYKYAGLQYATECFCGNTMRRSVKRAESECQTPCDGNKKQICGGTWRMSVYFLN